MTTSKTKQFCETSFKNRKLSAALTASYQCVLRFFHSTCLKYCACHEKVMPGHTKCCTVTRNHLSKPEDLMLQNATHLRKSAPWPPNISHERVFCTAPATENASLQILFTCPTPALVFGNATKPSRFAHFWQGAQPLRLPRETTSEPPKVARACGVLYILTSQCASRHNGVHFFDISTSKSGPALVCFVHFDFEIAFAPQLRALSRHRNFQKWSERKVFFTFFTYKCASRHNGVHFFISHLARWLRTRRFSEPTFRPSGATNHWKTQCRDFPTFSSICIFFLLTLSLLWSALFYTSSSAFHLSILSEIWLLNFLRQITNYITLYYITNCIALQITLQYITNYITLQITFHYKLRYITNYTTLQITLHCVHTFIYIYMCVYTYIYV